jgi:dTDP-4-dehydrorhamnose reductase
VDAASRADARVILVSTVWVFDGPGHMADEQEPPSPVNSYGL